MRHRAYDERHNEARRTRWREDPEYRTRVLEAGRRYRSRNRQVINERQRRRKREARKALVDYYGGRCECCGESRWEFLAVDHVDGGGTRERRSVGTTAYYRKLLAAGGPLAGYRLLCHNCNTSLGLYGYCQHAIVDPEDAGMLDGVGFDTAAPQLISDFAR